MLEYHYEYVPLVHKDGSPYYGDHGPWRIADSNDDIVMRVQTEAEAKKFVREHNKKLPKNPNWKY